jgi:hypothetical protein
MTQQIKMEQDAKILQQQHNCFNNHEPMKYYSTNTKKVLEFI